MLYLFFFSENVSVASSPYRVSHEEAKQVAESVSCQSKVG